MFVVFRCLSPLGFSSPSQLDSARCGCPHERSPTHRPAECGGVSVAPWVLTSAGSAEAPLSPPKPSQNLQAVVTSCCLNSHGEIWFFMPNFSQTSSEYPQESRFSSIFMSFADHSSYSCDPS